MILRLIPATILSVAALVATATPAQSADWPTYGGSNARLGVVSNAPAFTGFRRRFAKHLDGEIYAQPLIAGGVIYAATENDTVYAFTRSGRRLFSRHLGSPVPQSDLPCGNIDPSGITGTPVVDAGSVFVVAFLRVRHEHVLFKLDARSGRVLFKRRVDPANPITQQQRGALLVSGGRVYVPFGGLYGDCGDYHGVVVSISTSGAGKRSYSNPAPGAGIWAPAGISALGDGTLLVATGNATGGPDSYQYANSVLALTPDLHRSAYWAPSDWLSLSQSDTDISAVAPIPLDDHHVLQAGKNGTAYLLNAPDLGGIGGELSHLDACSGAFGAPAYSPPFLALTCSDALVGVRVIGDQLHRVWRHDGGAGPALIAGDTVIYREKDGPLRAVRLSDGHDLGQADLSNPKSSFPSAAAAGDLLVEPGARSITVFGGI